MISGFIRDTINRRVDERMNEILGASEVLAFRDISDEKAYKEVSSYILEKKKEGVTQLSTLDVVLGLKIPADKVELVMEDLEKNKKVKEIN